MADATAQKSGSGSRALLWLLILALLGVVWWLASERNARKFTLASRGSALVVSRGRYFPTGTGTIGADDPLGKLYAGIALPAGSKAIAETEYDEQSELDRALYDLLSANAHALAKKSDPAAYGEADALARRLSLLPGLTAEELADLGALRAELAFWSAGADVQSALTALASARRKLEQVRANGGEHAILAGPLTEQLEPLASQLALLAPRFSPAGSVAVPTLGTQTAGAPTSGAAGVSGPADADAGTAALAPAVPPPSIASPPGAPATNSIVEPAHGASAPGSVSSGASRAQ